VGALAALCCSTPGCALELGRATSYRDGIVDNRSPLASRFTHVRWLTVLLASCGLVLVSRGRASAPDYVERLELVGARRVHTDTLLALLPRDLPAAIDDRELDEFTRRLSNLAVFDAIAVTRRGSVLQLTVREKWTLLPNFSLTTGKTDADLTLEVGATEFNFLGRAIQLAVAAVREQRAYGFYVSWVDHPYRQRRWAPGGALAYRSASYRFDGSQFWITRTARLELGASSPPIRTRYLRYQLGSAFQHERVEDSAGVAAPPSGYAAKLGSGFTFDRYRWHDVVPRGELVSLSVGTGFMAPVLQPRHYAELRAKLAVPLAHNLVLVARISAAVTTRGNANSSYLLGSVEGVRGLGDSLYRNWAQAFVNAELRQAVPLFERLLAQVVVFVDAAEFQRMNARGRRGEHVSALSCGGGVRLLPTFVASAVLRLDVARLLLPSPLWFAQLGVAQYF
jgi:Omp85 superfamily domain